LFDLRIQTNSKTSCFILADNLIQIVSFLSQNRNLLANLIFVKLIKQTNKKNKQTNNQTTKQPNKQPNNQTTKQPNKQKQINKQTKPETHSRPKLALQFPVSHLALRLRDPTEKQATNGRKNDTYKSPIKSSHCFHSTNTLQKGSNTNSLLYHRD
jgi:hypothetical protein